MNGAVGAFGQGFAQHLLGARRTGGDHHYFPAVLLFLSESFFQSVGIGLIHFVGNIFANPSAGFVKFKGDILLRDLLHADENFQRTAPCTILWWEGTGQYKLAGNIWHSAELDAYSVNTTDCTPDTSK